MSALPFRGPSRDRPGERVVLHTERGDVYGEVMWCVAEAGAWNVYVLSHDRRSVWRSPPSYIDRLTGGGEPQEAVPPSTTLATLPLPADPSQEVRA